MIDIPENTKNDAEERIEGFVKKVLAQFDEGRDSACKAELSFREDGITQKEAQTIAEMFVGKNYHAALRYDHGGFSELQINAHVIVNNGNYTEIIG